jgi:hypothetical protein
MGIIVKPPRASRATSSLLPRQTCQFARSVVLSKIGQGPVPSCAPTRSASTIFYLPDVIDHMPRHAPDRVAGVPSPSNQGLAGGELREHGSDLFPVLAT